jgi:hypothetical protein
MPRAGAIFTNSSRNRQGFNLIMNSDMRLAERGSILAGTGGAQFLLDRHAGWFQAAGTYTSPEIRASSLPSGFPGKSSILSAFRMVASDVSANSTFLRRQRIESFRLQQPVIIERVSFGFYLWVSNFQDVTIQLLQPTTGISDDWGSFSVVHQESFSVTTDSAWDFYKIENAQLDNLDGLEYRIALSNPISTSVTTDSYVTQMSLHAGTVFDRDYSLTNLNFWNEYDDCRRMFQKSYQLDVAPGTIASGGMIGLIKAQTAAFSNCHLRFPIPLRSTSPTCTIYSQNGTIGALTNDTNSTDVGSGFGGAPSSVELQIISGGTGLVPGDFYRCHYTLDAEL